ncbi:MAG: hypothetical protein GOU98_01300 [Candidatus Altiarchaeota archaeon]|nr:hypothetical protein [Candidatus Altiarchaeota archaeon]
MRVLLALLVLFQFGFSDTMIGETSVGIDMMPTPFMEDSCIVSDSTIERAITLAKQEVDLSTYEFVKTKETYCWKGEENQNMNVNLFFKQSDSEIDGKIVSVSINMYDFKDVDAVFSEKESQMLDYYLKERFVEYLSSGKDDEFYTVAYPVYNKEGATQIDCNSLKSVYSDFDKVYLNDQQGYCEVIIKVKTSEIRELVSNEVEYISYFSEDIAYAFEGEAKGIFDLEAISKNLNCELNRDDYYLTEIEDCHGFYRKEGRFHLSANKQIEEAWISVQVYGFDGDVAQVYVAVDGKRAGDFVSDAETYISEITSRFFGESIIPDLREIDYRTFAADEENIYAHFEGTKKASNLKLRESELSNMELVEDRMNKNYYGDTVSVNIGNPYIQLFVKDNFAEITSADEKMMYPPTQMRDVVITKNAVFARVQIDLDNEEEAIIKLDELTKNIVQVSDWSITKWIVPKGQYFGPVRMMYDSAAGMPEPMEGEVMTDTITQTVETRATKTSQIIESEEGQVQVVDSFNQEFPEFAEFDKEHFKKSIFSFISDIVDWLDVVFSSD